MLETSKFVLPTLQGGATELTREQYRALIEHGGLSPRQRSSITTAAQILNQLSASGPLSFAKILEAISGSADTKPSTAEWSALDALLEAGLIRKLGGGWTTRYSLPAPR